MRIVLKQNDKAQTFVASIQMPDAVKGRDAATLAIRMNTALAEMDGKGLLAQSVFAQLAGEDE